MDKRKTVDGHLIPETRQEFRFHLVSKYKTKTCYTKADTKEQAWAMVERTITEARWAVKIEEAA
jgi:hypothetical protein